MQHRDYIVIRKVIDEIDIGLEMLGDTELLEFMGDEKLKRAVAMTVINIGELIKNVTLETRSKYPEIPWRAAAGMRDLAAHKYQTLRMEDVYQTARTDFPALKAQLERVIFADV
ncbi:MAG: DUF86 domain-containing protein [Clostridiales bacterium]|nr:DUF86 domain-containing protein [Clostridiales bacterium]